jgi:hypothetical protein
VIQHLVEEIGYIPPHRRKRRDPRFVDSKESEEHEWDYANLRYDDIDESDLPPVTDTLIQRMMESSDSAPLMKPRIDNEFEGKPKIALFLDSATHLSKFNKSFKFALKLPEKYPNISVVAGFYTSRESSNNTLQQGVIEFIDEHAYVFDLHPNLFDIVTSNIPISEKARLHGHLQEMSKIREDSELAFLEFIKERERNWRLLSSSRESESITKPKREMSLFSKIKERIKGINKEKRNK